MATVVKVMKHVMKLIPAMKTELDLSVEGAGKLDRVSLFTQMSYG